MRQSRAVSCAIVYIIATFTKFEIAQWNVVPLSQPFEFRMIPPDVFEDLFVDATQLNMAHLDTGNHDPVGTYRDR